MDKTNAALTLLPFLALLLTAASVGGLYYWWVSTRAEADDEASASDKADRRPQETGGIGDKTVGEFFGGLIQSARTMASNLTSSSTRATSLPMRQPMPTGTSVPVADAEAVEVLRVFRDLADGAVLVEIGGQRYYSLSQMTDPQVRRRFMGNALSLAQFAQLSEVPPEDAPQPVLPPMPAPVAPQPVTPTPVPGATPPPSEEDAPAPLAMADEIEELLQYRLTLSPELKHRSIHIRPGIGGAIQIEVDGAFFDELGDVMDGDVRELIQSVINEWEARH